MKIDLHIKPTPKWFRDHDYVREFQWSKGLPFLVNPRGQLVHRVRSAVTITWGGKHSHDVARYWCGNNGRGEFTDNPPTGKLLCAFCEAKAVAAGEKSASELAGRHVCIGTLKAVRQCCTNIEN